MWRGIVKNIPYNTVGRHNLIERRHVASDGKIYQQGSRRRLHFGP
jgi:hypothetical protein